MPDGYSGAFLAVIVGIIVGTLKDQNILIWNIEKQACTAVICIKIVCKTVENGKFLLWVRFSMCQSMVILTVQKKRSKIIRNMIQRSIHRCKLKRKRVMIVLDTLLQQKAFSVFTSNENTKKKRDAGQQVDPE